MKKRLLLGVALGALAAVNPVMAADMLVKAPVYKAPAMAAYTWTGCYAGGNIGYSWGRSRGDLNIPALGDLLIPLATSNPISLSPRGLVGGAQIGCNQQFGNSWVLGLETDFQGSAQKASSSIGAFNTNGEGFSGTVEAKLLWFGTLRGRAGVLITPTVLLYGTGGLTYGKTSFSTTITAYGFPGQGSGFLFGSTATTSTSDSKTKFGWTLGAGVEGAFADSSNWTWKFEYLYIDLGSLSETSTDPVIGAYSWSAKITDNIVRVGLNYRFP
jgi:outer membrane immunogenic protein